jgi:hypothetical protein
MNFPGSTHPDWIRRGQFSHSSQLQLLLFLPFDQRRERYSKPKAWQSFNDFIQIVF